MNTPQLTLARFNALAVLATGVLLSAGCANMQTTAASGITGSSQAVLSGRVHGGNQPVAGATIQLYAVGQTGVGQSGQAVLYATTTTSNNGTGSFAFNQMAGQNASGSPTAPNTPNYQCPNTSAPPLMYIYSRGGNTTGNGNTSQENTAAAFLAPVGYCNQINNSTFVDVSEVTTVATVAAVAQFISPNTDQISNDGIGVAYAAMGNAFATIPNLVSAATGLSNTTTTLTGSSSGTGVSAVNMTVTAPSAQLNTMANIISACVNSGISNSSNCTNLFNYAVPPASSATQSQPNTTYYAADDTVKAALYMILNPTDGPSSTNLGNLFNLQPAAGAPYAPALSSAPNNWLLAMTYTSNSTCGTSNSTFFSNPYDLNVDINGNVWIANKAGTNAAIAQISPNGQPLTCVSLGSSSLGGGVVDIGTNGDGSDPTIWYTDNAAGKVYGYTPSLGTTRTFTAPGALAITADGGGNVFYTTLVSGVGSVYELIGANATNDTSNGVLLSNNLGPNPARIFPDSASDLWISSGSNYVTELVYTATTGSSHNYLATQYSVTGPTYGIIVGPNNRVYVTSGDTNSTETVLAPPTSVNGSYSVLYTTSTANTGGLNNPTQLWLDGAQNTWVGNYTAESSGSYALSELTPRLTALSGSGTGGGYQNSTISAPRTTVVDSIGNVWVASDNKPNTITQFLGAAVPIYAPYPFGIHAGRFQSIP